MKKSCLLLCLFSLSGCVLPKVGYIVNLKNVCGYPVEVVVPDYIYPPPLEKKLEAGETSRIFQIIGTFCTDDRGFFSSSAEDLGKCLTDYSMTISANGKQIVLNNEDFLNMLEKAEKTKTGDIYTWTIKDPSLCPK